MADTEQADTENGASVPFTEQIKEQTQQAVQQSQQYAGQAVDLMGTRVKSALTQQKDALATGITETAQVLKQNSASFRSQGIGTFAGPYIDQAAQKLSDVGATIQAKDIDEVIRDTENFARIQPAYFLGAATLIGFVAARFLKSSGAQAASA